MKRIQILLVRCFLPGLIIGGTFCSAEPNLVWLRNGSVLEANIGSIDAESAQLTVQGLDHPPLVVPLSEIEEVSLPHPAREKVFYPVRLHFPEGRTLSGSVGASKNGRLSFKTYWGQKIQVELDHLLEVEMLSAKEDVLVSGPLLPEDWVPDRSHDDPTPDPDGIKFIAGRIHLESMYAFHHTRPFDSAPRTKTELTFRFEDILLKGYVIKFLKSPAYEHRLGGLQVLFGQMKIDLWDGHKKLNTVDSFHKKFIRIPPEERVKQYRWEIFCDREVGKAHVFLNGQSLYSGEVPSLLDLKGAPGEQETIFVKGMSHPNPSIFEHFQVTRWNGVDLPGQDVPPEPPYVVLEDYQTEAILEGSIEFLRKGNIRYLTRKGVKEKILSGPAIRKICLKDQGPFYASAEAVELRSQSTGDTMEVSGATLHGKEFYADAPFTKDRLNIPRRYVNSLRFTLKEQAVLTDSMVPESVLVLKSGERFPVGEWVINGEVLEVSAPWTKDVIRVPLEKLLKMTVEPGEKRYFAHTSRMRALDGSTLQGYIPGSDVDRFRFRTNWGQEITVPLNQVFSYALLSKGANVRTGLHLEQDHFHYKKYNRETRRKEVELYDVGESLQIRNSFSLESEYKKIPVIMVVKAELETKAEFPKRLKISFQHAEDNHTWYSYSYSKLHTSSLIRVHSQSVDYKEERVSVRQGQRWKIAVWVDLPAKMARLYINDELMDETKLADKYQGTPVRVSVESSDVIVHNVEVIELDPFRMLQTGSDPEKMGKDPSVTVHLNELPLLSEPFTSGWVQVQGPANSGALLLQVLGQTDTHLIGKTRFTEDELRIPLDWIRSLVFHPSALTKELPRKRPWLNLDTRVP